MYSVDQFVEDSLNVVNVDKLELLTQQPKCLPPMAPAFSEVNGCCTSL